MGLRVDYDGLASVVRHMLTSDAQQTVAFESTGLEPVNALIVRLGSATQSG